LRFEASLGYKAMTLLKKKKKNSAGLLCLMSHNPSYFGDRLEIRRIMV
jgi:hypothetical protein